LDGTRLAGTGSRRPGVRSGEQRDVSRGRRFRARAPAGRKKAADKQEEQKEDVRPRFFRPAGSFMIFMLSGIGLAWGAGAGLLRLLRPANAVAPGPVYRCGR